MKIFNRLHPRLKLAAAGVAGAAVAVCAPLALITSPSGASTGTVVTWSGNGGTETGVDTNQWACGSFNEGLTGVPAGDQGWLFIETGPDGTGPYELTATFVQAGMVTVAGSPKGDGSVHFVVYTPQGDLLESASATDGSGNSVLTVSGCTNGAAGTDPTTTTTTTTTDPTTTTTTTVPPTTTTTDPTTTTTTTVPPTTTTTTTQPPTTTTTTASTTTTTASTTTTTTDPTTTTTTASTTTTTDPTTGSSTNGGSTGGSSSGGSSGGGSTGGSTGGGSTGDAAAPANSASGSGGGSPASTAAPTNNQSGLAFTGADIGAMAAAGLAMVGLGGFLIFLTRHRRRQGQLS